MATLFNSLFQKLGVAYFVLVGCVLGLGSTACAQDDVRQRFKAVMSPTAYNQTVESSQLYAQYVLGLCFDAVRNAPLVNYSADLNAWDDLEDFNVTKNLQLFNPKTSPDNFTIVDLTSTKTSCWTQHDTLATPLSILPLMEQLIGTTGQALQTLENQSGEGFERRIFSYGPKDGKPPVIVYIYATFAPKNEAIVTIVQQASVTETK